GKSYEEVHTDIKCCSLCIRSVGVAGQCPERAARGCEHSRAQERHAHYHTGRLWRRDGLLGFGAGPAQRLRAALLPLRALLVITAFAFLRSFPGKRESGTHAKSWAPALHGNGRRKIRGMARLDRIG